MEEKTTPDVKPQSLTELDTIEHGIVEDRHVDKAYEFMKNYAAGPLSPADDKRILRKIDRNLLPLVCKTSSIFLSVYFSMDTNFLLDDYHLHPQFHGQERVIVFIQFRVDHRQCMHTNLYYAQSTDDLR